MHLPGVVKLNKSVAVFENHVSDAAVALEEPFNVTLPTLGGDVPDKDSAGRHGNCNCSTKINVSKVFAWA